MATGNRRRGRVIIIISLILILVLVLVWVFTRSMGGDSQAAVDRVAQVLATPTPGSDMGTIVVTSQKVQRGATFTEAVLTTIPFPKKDMMEGAFYTDTKELIGKRAKSDIEAHTPITSSIVVSDSTGSQSAFGIPKGMVAITIPIGKLSSVGYGLQAGDHVNVITSLLLVDIDPAFQSQVPNMVDLTVITTLTGMNPYTGKPLESEDGKSNMPAITQYMQGRTEMEPGLGKPIYVLPSEKQRPRIVSQTLIQDAVVLRVGQAGQAAAAATTTQTTGGASPTPAAAQQQQKQEAPPLPDIITLVVTPQDAVTLNYLMLANAKLNLVMRSAGDDQRIRTEAVTLQFLLDQYNIPSPAKLPYGLEPRTNEFPSSVKAFPDNTGTTTAPPQ